MFHFFSASSTASTDDCPTKVDLTATQITVLNYILNNLSVTLQDVLDQLTSILGQTVLGLADNNSAICLQLDANVTDVTSGITSALSGLITSLLGDTAGSAVNGLLNGLLGNTNLDLGALLG